MGHEFSRPPGAVLQIPPQQARVSPGQVSSAVAAAVEQVGRSDGPLARIEQSRGLRDAVDALPLIDPPRDLEQLRRACVVVGLSRSCINGGSVPWDSVDETRGMEVQDTDGKPKVLPAALAVPWLRVTGALGLPPVLTAMLDLWNWRRPPGAAFSPEEMRCISTRKIHGSVLK